MTTEVILVGVIIALLFLYVNKSVRDVGEKLFSNHKSWAITIYLALGVVCYAIGYHFYTEETIIHALILRMGDLMIIGVLIGFITNYARFNDIFKKSQIECLYSVDEIKNRKDLDQIWRNVSDALFKSRFPKINRRLLEIIDKYYFPHSEKGYYNDYVCEYHIKFTDNTKVYLQSDEHITYTYVTDTKGKISMETSSWVNFDAAQEESCCSDIVSFKVDGVEKKTANNVTQERDDKYLKTTINVDISGKNEYSIEIKYKKIVKFDEDHDIGFSARRITNNLTAKLYYSDDLTEYFRKSGTIKEFEEHEFDHMRQVKYQGLILSRQGYIFVLGRKQ